MSKTQAADSLPEAILFPRNRVPGGDFWKFSPWRLCAGKGGCRMALSEILTLLAVIISLLGLIFTVIFGTFDIAWKIAERQSKNGQKK